MAPFYTLLLIAVIGEIFGHNRVEILVIASPTGYMLTFSGVPFIKLGYFV